MFPARTFAPRLFAPRYFAETGMDLVATGCFPLPLPLALKGLVQPTQPGSGTITGPVSSIGPGVSTDSSLVRLGSGASTVTRKGSAVE